MGSEETIPAFRDLSTMKFMEINDSILRKGLVASLLGYELLATDGNALLPFVDVPIVGIQKKGKVDTQQGNGQDQQQYVVKMPLDDNARSLVCEVEREAASPGAAGTLTGPFVSPRQQQRIV